MDWKISTSIGILSSDVRRPSSVELATDIAQEARQLGHLQLDLAKQELREILVRNGAGLALAAIGLGLLSLAVLVALPVFLVLHAADRAAAALIWLIVDAGLGTLLIAVGLTLARRLLRGPSPRRLLPRTFAALQENQAWLLRQLRSNGR
ncbi:MAG TPA: phage holin family protein [Candidatus Dormibacteraeota bacterium]|nr:phage holin family protein [Candidatus Dormibacteraeota bacterium]